MKIDLVKLVYDQIKEIEVKGSYKIAKNYWQNSEIVSLKDVDVFGKISKNVSNELELNLDVKGIMVLKDSRTLVNVDYLYNLNINQILDENKEIKQNILDIEPILWENILLEVPIRIVSDNSPMNLKGEGWELKED
ncbi:MAG TPA: hypothetical protein PLX66_02775 [Bacilli bacterium]|nr:hypothetical protein [Bacilli bacterium]